MGKVETCEDEICQLITNFIENSGYRMTYPRRKILSEFIKNKEKHLSAEDVYNRLKDEGIGISTVYRNVNLFMDLEIIKELKIEDTSYYELRMYAKKSLHIHFVCDRCGDIIDIKDKDTILKYLNINYSVENNYGIQISDLDIMFHGLCKICAAEEVKIH